MKWVIDASAAVEFLLRTPAGMAVEALLPGGEPELLAPDLIDVEVLSVLRRLVRAKRVTLGRAGDALEDLAAWDLERIPARVLLPTAWSHRDTFSAYDAVYVAAAELSGAALLTADGPIARAPRLGIVVHNIRA